MNSRSITSILTVLALLFSASACAKRARSTQRANDQQPASATQLKRVNINTASANELETLPGIGKGLATRIVDHRTRWGAFRRPEHIIIVRGISDRRFRALRDLITVE